MFGRMKLIKILKWKVVKTTIIPIENSNSVVVHDKNDASFWRQKKSHFIAFECIQHNFHLLFAWDNFIEATKHFLSI